MLYTRVTKKTKATYQRLGRIGKSLVFGLSGLVLIAPFFMHVMPVAAAPQPFINEYPIPHTNETASSITTGSDGNVWFTSYAYQNIRSYVGRVDKYGNITDYQIQGLGTDGPGQITNGPDGALWFGEPNSHVGRIDTSGNVSTFQLPSGVNAESLSAGSDGALWFTEQYSAGEIGRLDVTTGIVTQYPLPAGTLSVGNLISGSDGALWFVDYTTNSIGRIDLATGTVTEYAAPSGQNVESITNGPDGNIWIPEDATNGPGGETDDIAQMDITSGNYTQYPLPDNINIADMTTGSDGALWFVEGTNDVGRMTTSGAVSEYQVPTADSQPFYITSGGDGNIWFSEISGPNDGEPNNYQNIGQVQINPDLYAVSPSPTPALTWNAVPGADSYNIYRDYRLIGTSNTNSYTDSTAPSGIHKYYMTSVTGGVESSPSNMININVEPVSLPAFTSDNSTVMPVNENPNDINFQITTGGTPYGDVTESGALPAGVEYLDYKDGTGYLVGSPDVGTVGTYPITFSATNSVGTTTQAFTLTVSNDKTFPYIGIYGNTAFNLEFGQPYSETYRLYGNPLPSLKTTNGATIVPGVKITTDTSAGTVTFSGTPTGSASGPTNVQFAEKNSQGTYQDYETYTVSRSPAFAPIKNQKAALTAVVGNYFDPEILSYGYGYPTFTESGALPSGLSFDDIGNGYVIIDGTPNTGSGGAYPITITATNSYGTATQSYTLLVDEAPTITSADSVTTPVKQPLSFQVTGAGYPVTYSESGALPANVKLTKAGLLKGTPKAGTSGIYPITITATDSQGTVTQNFTLTVQ